MATQAGPDCQGERQTLERVNGEARMTGMRPKSVNGAQKKKERNMTPRGEKCFFDKKAVSR